MNVHALWMQHTTYEGKEELGKDEKTGKSMHPAVGTVWQKWRQWIPIYK